MSVKSLSFAFALATAAAAFSGPVVAAEPPLYKAEDQAQAACGDDAVVWIDIQRERYYARGSSKYGVGTGFYSCEKPVKAKYRAGKD